MEKIKVAVAGLGFIGPAHIEALRRIPNIEVVAISDIDEATARAKARELGIERSTADFDDLLSDEIESVHICTPNNLHYEMAKKALNAGKHVICEKPLATTVEEAEELVALAKQKKLVNAKIPPAIRSTSPNVPVTISEKYNALLVAAKSNLNTLSEIPIFRFIALIFLV